MGGVFRSVAFKAKHGIGSHDCNDSNSWSMTDRRGFVLLPWIKSQGRVVASSLSHECKELKSK